MKITLPHNFALLLMLAWAPHAFSQGSLTPPGGPAPSMKSLQQIWDKLEDLESDNASLKSQVAGFETQQSLLTSVVLEEFEVDLPWEITTIDLGSRDCSLAFDHKGFPAISFRDTNGGQNLRLARYDGIEWTVETVHNVSALYTSLAFTPMGHPAISYWANNNLNYAEYNGSSWSTTVVDSAFQTGLHTSLAFDSDGNPAISYFDTNLDNLKYASFDGSSWSRTTIDSIGSVGLRTSLAFSPSGFPHISYQESGGIDRLKVAIFSGSEWSTTTVDSIAGGTYPTSIAFSNVGRPIVAYTLGGKAKFAEFDGSSWNTVEIAPAMVGSQTYVTLTVLPNGRPAVAFYNSLTGDLIYASFNGTDWRLAEVEVEGDAGRFASIAMAPSGQPAIAYTVDGLTGDLRYAIRSVFPTNP